MRKFLKLTNSLININHIHHIDIEPNRFHLLVSSHIYLQGDMWAGTGTLEIKIDHKTFEKHSPDIDERKNYEIIKKFINEFE